MKRSREDGRGRKHGGTCSKGLLGDGSPCSFLVLEILQDSCGNRSMTKNIITENLLIVGSFMKSSSHQENKNL